MTAMPDHAPLITTLRPGILTVETDAGDEEYFVTGGFAEISGAATTVLAEAAMPKAEVTSEMLGDLLTQAREAQSAAAPEMADAAAKAVADIASVGAELGFSTAA